jgi:hypothetical protein
MSSTCPVGLDILEVCDFFTLDGWNLLLTISRFTRVNISICFGR